MTDSGPSGAETGGGRSLWLAVLLVAAIVIPRSIAISQAHTESVDDEYHRVRGLAFLARTLDVADISPGTVVNDPPLGEGIVAFPIWVANLACGRVPTDPGLYDHRLSPEFLLGLIAAWKALLFLPMVAVVFAWCREIYGPRSAWLSAGLLAVEPTFAAHIPIPALDTLGTESIVIAAFLGWRSFQHPTRVRQALAGLSLAVALAIKHTALVFPAVLAAYAVLWWGLKPALDRTLPDGSPGRLFERLGAIQWTVLSAVFLLWAVHLFDVSPKSLPDAWESLHPEARAVANLPPREVVRLPAGSYIRSVKEGLKHNARGHPAFLLGEKRQLGWWYYFPVVAAYKIPVGVGVILILGMVSLRRVRPRWSEWGLFVPAGIYLMQAMATKLNIGFRHFLPPYAFLLMLSTRFLVGKSNRLTWAAWLAVGSVAVHSALIHPDYLSYINGPWDRPHLAISDSNLDWGQALKEVRTWVDARLPDSRKVHLVYFGTPRAALHYLGDRPIEVHGPFDPMPVGGLLIVSPVIVAGPYDKGRIYESLQAAEPIDIIGHSLLVYDLDRLHRPKSGDAR